MVPRAVLHGYTLRTYDAFFLSASIYDDLLEAIRLIPLFKKMLLREEPCIYFVLNHKLNE